MAQSAKASPALINLWAHLPGNYWVIDKAFTLMAISNGYLDLLGEKRFNLVGKNILDLFHQKPYPLPVNGANSLRNALENVKITGKEEKITLKTGTFPAGQVFELLYRPVLGENGEVEHIIHEAKTIEPAGGSKKQEPAASPDFAENERFRQEKQNTENPGEQTGRPQGEQGKLQAKIAARKSEVHFHALFSQVIVGIAETKLDGTYTLVNDRYASMVGYSREELLHMRMQDITHPDDLSRNLEQYRQMIRTGEPFELEKRYIRKDGATIWVHNSVSVVTGAGGEAQSTVAISIDISERKEIELSNARLVAVVNNSDDAIISKDLNGNITSWNKGATRLFGFTATEAIGQAITIIIPPERYQEEYEILKKLRSGEMVDHFETIRLHKDGTPLNISLTISPIRDSAGKIVGASKIGRDITGQKRSQEALQRSEARYRGLFNSIDMGFCIIKFIDTKKGPLSDFLYIEANPALATESGITDVVGKTVRQGSSCRSAGMDRHLCGGPADREVKTV